MLKHIQRQGEKMKKIILTMAAFLIANAPNEGRNQVPGNNEVSLGNQMPANSSNILTSSEQVVRSSCT